jgi:transcriptional regulator with XRE-family HTH domain
LAEQSSVQQALLSLLEAGKREPTDEVLGKLAPALGIGFWELKQATFDDRISDEEAAALTVWLAQRRSQRIQWSKSAYWATLPADRLDYEVGRLLAARGYTEWNVSHQMRRRADWFLESHGRKWVVTVVPDGLVDRQTIGKLTTLRQEVGGDEILLVTRSEIDPETAALAALFSVQLVDCDTLALWGSDGLLHARQEGS